MAEKSKWNRDKTVKIVYTGLFVAIIAACAQIAIPMAVPFTLQTLAVCLAGGLLGWKMGTLAVLVYIILGGIGVPIFASFTGGFSILFGSTGGYIIGFIFTAFIVGLMTEKLGKKLWVCALSMVIGVAVCYVFGTIWFAVVYNRSNSPASLATILGWCVVPFILPDLAKIAVATVLTNRLARFVKVKK